MEQSNVVLIAGAGIGGLATALTLHQIGVPCRVLESVHTVRPLGVGINLQPNAIRELFDLGFTEACLDRIGCPTREWALVARNGKEIYAEPRGRWAGYRWPQYSVHRGRLQMMLYEAVLDRMGPDAIQLGHRVCGYRVEAGDGVTALVENRAGVPAEFHGRLLIGADGIHSAVRARMYPDQPDPHWGGAIMWRGISQHTPIRTGCSFLGLGFHDQRMVLYPITPPDPHTGLVTMNWIAEITADNAEGWSRGDWNRRVDAEDIIPHFDSWRFDWLDVPALIRGAEEVFEYPMIDRDPVPSWVDGPVALLGDAAHAMYPTGSNGASQAIVDARVLGAAMVRLGITPAALAEYDALLCEDVSRLVLRNRGAGPFGILKTIEARSQGEFDDINDVISADELEAFMTGYKSAAGFAMDRLNAAEPTIAPSAISWKFDRGAGKVS